MISASEQEGADEVNEDEWSPFPNLTLLLAEDEDGVMDQEDPRRKRRQGGDSGGSQYPVVTSLSMIRDWGIPSFQDQMDRGIRTFELKCLDDNEGYLVVSDPRHSNLHSSSQSSPPQPTPPVVKPVVVLHLDYRRHSTGSDLWDSALVLAHALPRLLPVLKEPEWSRRRLNAPVNCNTFDDNNNNNNKSCTPRSTCIRDMTVLELGSGTGAVGLYCVKCLGMKRAILTDQCDNLALIRKNCVANQVHLIMKEKEELHDGHDDDNPHHHHDEDDCHSDSGVTVCALDWRDSTLPSQVVAVLEEEEENGLDLILGSDLFLPFAADLLLPLAERLAQILSWPWHTKRRDTTENSNNNKRTPVALLAYEDRFDCSAFFAHATLLNLNVEEVDSSWLHPKYQDPDRIHVLRITYIPPIG